MKKYPKNFTEKIKNFLQLDFKIKFKKFLTLVGLKFFLYNSLFFIVKLINKNRSPFVRCILFDALKYKSKLEIVENKHKEKFIIFTNDNVISKEIFVSEEFDIKKVYKALDFLNKKVKFLDFLILVQISVLYASQLLKEVLLSRQTLSNPKEKILNYCK